MHDDRTQLDRRGFLKIGTGGLMAAAASRLWDPVPGARSQPAVLLRSSGLELRLDPDTGLPIEYRLPGVDAGFHGAADADRIAVLLCHRQSWTFIRRGPIAASVDSTRSQADVRFEIADGSVPAASFTLRYLLDGASVVVSMRDVREQLGYELIEVGMPRLVSLHEEDGHGWLAHADGGGNLVALSEAKSGSLLSSRSGKVHATLPVVMLGTGRALCVQEVTSFMDGTELQVSGDAGHRRATLGTIKSHRVNGSLCYDLSAGPGTPRSCGTPRTPNLLVDQESSCRLDFVASSDRGRPATWIDGAHLVRRRLPAIPNRLYDRACVYGILVDDPGLAEPPATFAQCEELIRHVAALTGNARQIVHLWGVHYRGKDSGYPAVDQVSSRAGGYDGLIRLMERARQSNCTVTLSDNYDDAYRTSPKWDPAIVARRPDGELWESRNGRGESSYVIGTAKYMRGPGVERVRYTCERYKLPGTTHVDLLSSFPVRNDWDPARPASGIKNLREGRYKVLDEYAKYGVDVSLDTLRYAFVGRVSAFRNLADLAPCPFGGTAIPLLAAVYRQSAVWGQEGRGRSRAEQLLTTFFHNGPPYAVISHGTDVRTMTDVFYLMMVPWFRLQARSILSFERRSERTIIGLEDNATIDMHWGQQTYALTDGGVEIARDEATFCPLDEYRLAFYATKAGELAAALPAGWNPSRLAAFALTGGAPEKTAFKVANGKIHVTVAARQPVLVFRDAT
jgi:hypothetical protein